MQPPDFHRQGFPAVVIHHPGNLAICQVWEGSPPGNATLSIDKSPNGKAFPTGKLSLAHAELCKPNCFAV